MVLGGRGGLSVKFTLLRDLCSTALYMGTLTAVFDFIFCLCSEGLPDLRGLTKSSKLNTHGNNK